MIEDDILNMMDKFLKEEIKNKHNDKESFTEPKTSSICEEPVEEKKALEWYNKKIEKWYSDKIRLVKEYFSNNYKYPEELTDIIINPEYIKKMLEPEFDEDGEITYFYLIDLECTNDEDYYYDDDIKGGKFPDRIKRILIEELIKKTRKLIFEKEYLKYLKICKIHGIDDKDIEYLVNQIIEELKGLNNANHYLVNTSDYHREYFISNQKLYAIYIALIDFYQKGKIKKPELIYKLILSSLYYLEGKELETIIQNTQINNFINTVDKNLNFISCIPNINHFQNSNLLFILKILYKKKDKKIIPILRSIVKKNSDEKEKRLMLYAIEDFENVINQKDILKAQNNLIRMIGYISDKNNIIFYNYAMQNPYTYCSLANGLYTDFLEAIMKSSYSDAEKALEYYIVNIWPHIIEDWIYAFKAIINILTNKGTNAFKNLVNKNIIIVNYIIDTIIDKTQISQKCINKNDIRFLLEYLASNTNERKRIELLIAIMENRSIFKKINNKN